MKNILKSIFISSFPLLALFIFLSTILKEGIHPKSIGTLIISLIISLFFSLLFIKPVARTDKFLFSYSIPISIGFILNLLFFNWQYFTTSFILALGWTLYLTWYSAFTSRDSSILELGKTLPNLTFENHQKELISLASLSGDFKVILFFRGNWCPLCMAQIKEIADDYILLKKRNIDVVLVSSQSHKNTENLAKKHKVPFHFLIDKDNRVAKNLNIIHKNGLPMGFQVFGYKSDVILPTLIIINKVNEIIFTDLTDNYRVRPEPATFLKIIDNY